MVRGIPKTAIKAPNVDRKGAVARLCHLTKKLAISKSLTDHPKNITLRAQFSKHAVPCQHRFAGTAKVNYVTGRFG
jgi:hypothetical protein